MMACLFISILWVKRNKAELQSLISIFYIGFRYYDFGAFIQLYLCLMQLYRVFLHLIFKDVNCFLQKILITVFFLLYNIYFINNLSRK